MRRLQSWLIVLFFALMTVMLGQSSRAAQNTCILPTVGTVSGLTLVQDINLCFAAQLSVQSGASAPSSPTTGMLWMDTSTSPRAIKQYDGSNWSIVWWLDNTNHLIASAAVTQPGGRLTLTTLTPVLTSSVSGATTLYYTPFRTDLMPIYNGTNWTTKGFTELSVSLASSANWASASLYDWFVINDAGTIRLCSGPAWTSTTARGTGAGTTELQMVNGIYVNKVSATCRYGAASTVTAAAQTGTYVGTTYMTANGQTSVTFGSSGAGGVAGTFAVWNTYNRVPFSSISLDSTASWVYSTATWRGADNSTTIRHTFVVGLSEDSFSAHYAAITDLSGGPSAAGVGYDVTNAPSGINQTTQNNNGPTVRTQPNGIYKTTPTIGLHFVNAIEFGGASTTWIGVGSGFTFDWRN